MTRYIRELGASGESPRVDAFIDEVLAVCRRHGLGISHEDTHGVLLVVNFSEGNADYLREASDDATLPRPLEQLVAREFQL